MDRFRPYPAAAFSGVTLLIWGNRVWLAWTDSSLDLGEKLRSSVPITCFVAAAVAVLVLQARQRADRPAFVALVSVFAAGTVAFWAVRLPAILVHHHPVAFKLVHTALAAVSVTLAVRAWRAVRRPLGPAAGPAPRPDRERVGR